MLLLFIIIISIIIINLMFRFAPLLALSLKKIKRFIPVTLGVFAYFHNQSFNLNKMQCFSLASGNDKNISLLA